MREYLAILGSVVAFYTVTALLVLPVSIAIAVVLILCPVFAPSVWLYRRARVILKRQG